MGKKRLPIDISEFKTINKNSPIDKIDDIEYYTQTNQLYKQNIILSIISDIKNYLKDNKYFNLMIIISILIPIFGYIILQMIHYLANI